MDYRTLSPEDNQANYLILLSRIAYSGTSSQQLSKPSTLLSRCRERWNSFPPFDYLLHTFLSLAPCLCSVRKYDGHNSTQRSATSLVGWVPTPSGRGAVNIVWSCLSILLVCTYKCVRFNIPAFEEKEAGWLHIKGQGVANTIFSRMASGAQIHEKGRVDINDCHCPRN